MTVYRPELTRREMELICSGLDYQNTSLEKILNRIARGEKAPSKSQDPAKIGPALEERRQLFRRLKLFQQIVDSEDQG